MSSLSGGFFLGWSRSNVLPGSLHLLFEPFTNLLPGMVHQWYVAAALPLALVRCRIFTAATESLAFVLAAARVFFHRGAFTLPGARVLAGRFPASLSLASIQTAAEVRLGLAPFTSG